MKHCNPCFVRGKNTPAAIWDREPAYLESVPYGYCEECHRRGIEMKLEMLSNIMKSYQTLLETQIEIYEKYGVKKEL